MTVISTTPKATAMVIATTTHTTHTTMTIVTTNTTTNTTTPHTIKTMSTDLPVHKMTDAKPSVCMAMDHIVK